MILSGCHRLGETREDIVCHKKRSFVTNSLTLNEKPLRDEEDWTMYINENCLIFLEVVLYTPRTAESGSICGFIT